MRCALPLVLLLAACSMEVPEDPQGPAVPRNLENLNLAPDSQEIGPVVFPHADHAERAFETDPLSCDPCHHDTRSRSSHHAFILSPDSPPQPCRVCHNPEETEVAKGDPSDLLTAMHQMCRSCHARPPPPDGALSPTDCTECHGDDPASPSLGPLLQDRSLSLSFTYDDSVPLGDRPRWEEDLLYMLEDLRVRVVLSGAPEALPALVHVSMDTSLGRARNGTPFFATIARAEISVGRARVRVRSKPGVSVSVSGAVSRALEDLILRVMSAFR